MGLSSALWLQWSGFRVTLVERGGPGAGASFGNAGRVTVDPTETTVFISIGMATEDAHAADLLLPKLLTASQAEPTEPQWLYVSKV